MWRGGMTPPVPQGGAVWRHGVVMGCGEPRARGGGAVAKGLARSGVVRIGLAGGAFRDGQGCWWWAGGLRRCHGVVTSGAKHGGTEGDTLRRSLQVDGRGGTMWDG